jgi:hypothetical protein
MLTLPDNDLRDFLSHHMKPIEQMVGFGTEIQREIAHGVGAVRQKGDRLIHREALRRQQLKESAFRVLIIAMHEPHAAGWTRCWDTLVLNDLEAACLPLGCGPCIDIPAIDTDRQRFIALRKLAPQGRTSLKIDGTCSGNGLLNAFRHVMDLPLDRRWMGLDGQDLRQHVNGDAIGDEAGPRRLETAERRCRSFHKQGGERTGTPCRLRCAWTTIELRTRQREPAKGSAIDQVGASLSVPAAGGRPDRPAAGPYRWRPAPGSWLFGCQ